MDENKSEFYVGNDHQPESSSRPNTIPYAGVGDDWALAVNVHEHMYVQRMLSISNIHIHPKYVIKVLNPN